MVRIAWRDLTGSASLEETMHDLTALAEACLDQALDWLYPRECARSGTPHGPGGRPQALVVIGMGKLGARELNFSSDVDLVFAYPQQGRTQGAAAAIGSDEFFARLCRRLIKAIGETTEDGFVFRVDTRLRPDGENGPLVMSFDNMETYYQIQGREWERYAWIKARPVAGDREAGQRLIDRLHPFVYRRYLDFGTFDALRRMKRSIAAEVRAKGFQNDIKLGPGGIREVEFFGQTFQLLRGGFVPALQQPGILTVLPTLAREQYIDEAVSRRLIDAYRFLRKTEHRLQAFSDQQTHRLPGDADGRERLALSMKLESWAAFEPVLERHRIAVRQAFDGLLRAGEAAGAGDPLEEELQNVWLQHHAAAEDAVLLARAGFTETEEALRLLSDLREHSHTRALSRDGRERLNALMPRLLHAAGRTAEPHVVLKRLLHIIESIQRRTTYLALLLENPDALTHLVRLTAASGWIAGFLARHPALFDELLDPRSLYAPPEKADLQAELDHRMARLDVSDLEFEMEQLCLFKQANLLRIAAADITEALSLMKVSDRLTYLAETVLDETVSLCWDHLAGKYGSPRCVGDAGGGDKGFVVIAYGKLGGYELGYSSDLDLVFLHAGSGEMTVGEKRSIDDTTFFARLGQRVLHMLTARTAIGFLYEADMRLRPSGSSGLLVSQIEGFRHYQLNDAWTWEHQALIKARPVCGDEQLCDRFLAIRKEVLARQRCPETLKQHVRDMRSRLREQHPRDAPNGFDLKHGNGGLIDIEFLVQYLILHSAYRRPDLVRWTDTVRLLGSLAAGGILSGQSANMLRKAYLTFRSKMHRLSLQERPARVSASDYGELADGVARLCRRHLG
jgi:glutamate-ammonia-ligase adenylyltransferase